MWWATISTSQMRRWEIVQIIQGHTVIKLQSQNCSFDSLALDTMCIKLTLFCVIPFGIIAEIAYFTFLGPDKISWVESLNFTGFIWDEW